MCFCLCVCLRKECYNHCSVCTGKIYLTRSQNSKFPLKAGKGLSFSEDEDWYKRKRLKGEGRQAPSENKGDSRLQLGNRGSGTRTVALNSQGSVPNSDTDVSGLTVSQLPCWTRACNLLWDRGPSEARRARSNQPWVVSVGLGRPEAQGAAPGLWSFGTSSWPMSKCPCLFACSFVRSFFWQCSSTRTRFASPAW